MGLNGFFQVIIALALVLLVAVLMYGHSTRCRVCKRWFALKKAEKKTLYKTKSERRVRHTWQCRFCQRRQGYEKNA